MFGTEEGEDDEEEDEDEEGEKGERLVLRRFLVTARGRGWPVSLSQARAVRASRERRNSRTETA